MSADETAGIGKVDWQFCAHCGDELDTGWECNGCGQDWMPYAYPWWRRLFEKIKACVPRRPCQP